MFLTLVDSKVSKRGVVIFFFSFYIKITYNLLVEWELYYVDI